VVMKSRTGSKQTKSHVRVEWLLKVFSRAGLLAELDELISMLLSDKRNAATYRMLKRELISLSPRDYLNASDFDESTNVKFRKARSASEPTGAITLRFDDRDAIKENVGAFKRELANAVLAKFGSYSECARRLNVSLPVISRFFSSKATPHPATLQKFAKAIGKDKIVVSAPYSTT
jgi:hypothetical protein